MDSRARQGNMKRGHRILYRAYILDPTEVLWAYQKRVVGGFL